MTVEIMSRPANAAAKVSLGAGESCVTEGGAMIAMSGDMDVQTHVRRGEKGFKAKLKGAARSLAGEGIFLNHFTAASSGGELYLAAILPGDMEVLELREGRSILVQSSSFVAHESGVEMQISWGGLKNVFSGESLIWLKLGGPGKAIINAFGVIYPIDVDGEYIVDTGNIVAYEDSLEFSISKAGKSWVSSIAGGEGLVTRFKGTGRVWCQSHADRHFGAKLTPHLVPKKN